MRKLFAATAAITLMAGTAYAMSGAADEPETTGWEARDKVTIAHPEWSKDAVLYQINTRHFTPEGTFAAAQEQLPRLKELGVDILWLMPIHPIGEEKRKGTLGSPYAVRDYYAVNPEFGTEEDFRAFVDAAHAQGFKVILDLVANHTAWDNDLAAQHPDWYEKDWKGDFRPTPWWDWSDIIDLDWSKPGVREHVGGAMEYWVREFGVDGYRADVAGYVPLDFWETARARLEAIRPVFMLGEVQETAFHHAAFDATYAWDWHNTSKNVAQGKGNATSFYGYYAENESLWPRSAMRMTYIENHDSNAWEGTMEENYGPALEAMTALSFTGEGLPLIHNGMEACNAKRLKFFEHDPIDWSQGDDCTYGDLLEALIDFRKANPVLANGQWGARMHKLETDRPEQVFAWARRDEGNKVVGLFNFSGEAVAVTPTSALADGSYSAFPDDRPVTVNEGEPITLPAWGYLLLSAKE
ncbi:alpha-amylase family glycosyl hydrolase [Erythrobacter sp.]|uniref:alpha-amylase family glycosyl hydrolase n=1 Tax=Erythrobacter sp. TaxID=1042 RepID=UPI001B1151D6|nr:alpha-amylase family glycosyl hydrolase [Erythrobacter sp.]MBO6525483.1 alpha-amylase [Erythrobacter sp.]MBO6529844.1 alpha-amylase [Erythrobacter sp.]